MVEGAQHLSARDRLLAWLASWLGWVFLQTVGVTSRFSFHHGAGARELLDSGKPVIYALWHRFQLLLVYVHRGEGVNALVSRSRDGEFIARAIGRFGFRAVRGSSSRGGGPALLEIVNRVRAGQRVCFTPDGPRGPYGSVQPGVAAAARLTGAPVVAVAWAGGPAKALSSWDRFLIPFPFGRYAVAYHEPLWIGPEESSAEDKVRDALDAARRQAERLLEPSR